MYALLQRSTPDATLVLKQILVSQKMITRLKGFLCVKNVTQLFILVTKVRNQCIKRNL